MHFSVRWPWSTIHVYPHQLCYFNEAAGGAVGGHKHLLHSNVDWGQDFLLLTQEMRPVVFVGAELMQPMSFLRGCRESVANAGPINVCIGRTEFALLEQGRSEQSFGNKRFRLLDESVTVKVVSPSLLLLCPTSPHPASVQSP